MVSRFERCVLPQAEEFLHLLLVKLTSVMSLKAVACLLPEPSLVQREPISGPFRALSGGWPSLGFPGELRKL